ncbi:MAG: bifunctional DNA primase/polymerase [Hyphomicrobiaceae bacterium]
MTNAAHSMPAVQKPFAEVAFRLLEMGYSPVPANGQACVGKGWPERSRELHSRDEIERFGHSPLNYNVALALGFNGLVIVDRDTDEPAVRDALRPIFTRIYSRGGIPCAKFGSKGMTTFFRWEGEAFRNRSFNDRHGTVILELSGAGRATVVPPSIHPKIGQPYRWTTPRTLLDTCPQDLPRLLPEDLQAIEQALAPFLPPQREPVPIRPSVATADLSEQDRRRHESYARRILEAESQTLSAMRPESGRNHRMFNLVCRVGKWVHAGILPPRDLTLSILAACESNGLTSESGRHAVVATINSGLAKSRNDALPDLGGRR